MGAQEWAVDLADELITEEGKPAAFYREEAASSADPDKPWRADGLKVNPPARHDVVVVTFPYQQKYIDGTVIQQGDVSCLLAAKGLTYVPKVGDYCVMSGVKYKALKVNPLEPGVDRVLYEIQLRG